MESIIFYGTDWCSDCQRAKKYLEINDIYFQFIDVDVYDWANDMVLEINNEERIIPTLIIDEVPYTNPDNEVLKEVLQIDNNEERNIYDTIVIIDDLTKLATVNYAKGDKFNTLILEKKNMEENASSTKEMEKIIQIEGARVEAEIEIESIIKLHHYYEIKTCLGELFGRRVVLQLPKNEH